MSVDNPYEAPQANVELSATDPEAVLRFEKMASGQKLVIYAVMIYFSAIFLQTLLGPAALIPVLLSLVLSLIGVLKVLAARQSHILTRIVLFLLMFVPLFNLFVLLSVNSRATKALREAGYKVGFLGASKADMDSAVPA